jgi:5-methylcytosine-specific restriction endonuclease McrA
MLKQKILKLREKGLTYDQIADELGCSKSTISYHLNSEQKEKSLKRQRKRRKSNPLIKKLEVFKAQKKQRKKQKHSTLPLDNILYKRVWEFSYNKKTGEKMKSDFNVNDVKEKIGDNPTCYLTGDEIDLSKTRSYEFDHIIPRSRGGDNSLENLGICTRQANQAKRDMTPDEFLYFCKKVLENNGYIVTK